MGTMAFEAQASVLCCPQLPVLARMRRFYATVGSTALWAAGCWVPSVKLQQLLSAQEARWLRRMLASRRRPEQEWVPYLRETKRQVYDQRLAASLPALWHRALAALHGWAGHLARGSAGHPGFDWVRWRGAEWWEITKAIGSLTCAVDWRHPRTNWRRGFEHAFVDHYGADWQESAAWTEREVWRARTDAWVRQSVRRWGGPRVARVRH